MKTALITTTINVPNVLALYRRFDPSGATKFFVAIDKKTPCEVRQFCDNIGAECVEATDYKCDQIIGWNSIQRRNLALLEALKWGADIIISVDDDNIPIDPNYFHAFTSKFITYETTVDYLNRRFTNEVKATFSGFQAGGSEWFDVGTLLRPSATHRGFPESRAGSAEFTHVIDANIGVAAGMVLGDPDTSAVERIAKRPSAQGVSEVLKAGLVVHPATHTVFNSQNTAFIRELAPAMMMWPGVGRYDDIFASLLCQRAMRDRGLHVHFGRPFVYQQRNSHNLVNDLKGELFGMEHLVKFAEWLNSDRLEFVTSANTVLDATHCMFAEMKSLDWMPKIVSECGLTWCEDIERVMG